MAASGPWSPATNLPAPGCISSSVLGFAYSRGKNLGCHSLVIYFLKHPTIVMAMPEWSFLTNHARALVCIARDPGVRLRDIAATLGVTERSAFGIVADLTTAGYVVKDKDGRRNRYRIQTHLPMPENLGPERTIGEVLKVLVDTRAPKKT